MAEPFIAQSDEVVDTLSDLFDVLETSIKGSIHTGLVAVVSSYDAASQTCEAQPVVKARFDNGDRFQIPVIPRIPVMFPSGGSFAITWPLEAGDFVFLSFAERSIDEWKAAGTQSTTPSDLRRFDLSDAVAYPGVVSPRSPLLSATDDSMVIGEDNPLGLQIKIKDGTITIGTPTAEFLSLTVDALLEVVTAWAAVQTFATACKASVTDPVLAAAALALETVLLTQTTVADLSAIITQLETIKGA